jgi:hypothetical protein
MTTRIIEASPDKLVTLQGRELIESIRASGGRTVAAEIVSFRPSLVDGVSNAELAASLGADMIHLNHYDVNKPLIAGLPSTQEGARTWAKAGLCIELKEEVEEPVRRYLSDFGMGVTVSELRRLIGRVVGISLEVVTVKNPVPNGCQANPETAAKAIEQGAAYITLVATPRITSEELQANVRRLRDTLGQNIVIIVGRMPWGVSDVDDPSFLSLTEIEALIPAGADVLIFPVPGTVQGATQDTINALVAATHRLGALAQVSVTASQESAEVATVRQLALDGRSTGADIYQMGDGGYSGMAIPENIQAFATVIKGRRHTYRRTASTWTRA